MPVLHFKELAGAADAVQTITHDRIPDAALGVLANAVGEALLQRNLSFTSAESCTGGLVAKLATDIAGSSMWFDRAFVTYSNAAKQEMLGVQETVLNTAGAVSGETVEAMAIGAISRSHADLSVAISGIAGPGGATPGKPVGTVWIAWACRDSDALPARPALPMQPDRHSSGLLDTVCFRFPGDRDTVRSLAAQYALQGILESL